MEDIEILKQFRNPMLTATTPKDVVYGSTRTWQNGEGTGVEHPYLGSHIRLTARTMCRLFIVWRREIDELSARCSGRINSKGKTWRDKSV